MKKALSKNYDIVIFTTAHSLYKKRDTLMCLQNMKSSVIYDTVNALNENQLKYMKKNHNVLILGRGDII